MSATRPDMRQNTSEAPRCSPHKPHLRPWQGVGADELAALLPHLKTVVLPQEAVFLRAAMQSRPSISGLMRRSPRSWTSPPAGMIEAAMMVGMAPSRPRPVMPHTCSRPAYHAGCCAAGISCDDIPFAQEFLGEMLGLQRTSVSIVANTLQQV